MSDVENLQAAIGDKYRIERELGHGGMATVYLARDLKLDREVAIKVLKPDLAHAVGADRFRREIEVVTRLSHPHILALYDWGDANGLLYYVMPFVQGESLRARLDREHQLPIEEAVKLTAEVATALDYAHAQGIMHRDIKPENILLDAGHAVIADFGIARVMDEAGSGPALTQTGVSIGTPTYMSPEQALAEKKIDGRADQYSLACVLYEMLAGHPPFTGGSLQALIMRHTMEQVPPLHVVRQTVAPELEDVVMRALAKSPADRFGSCAQFAQALLSPAGFTSSYRVSMAKAGVTRSPWAKWMPWTIAGGLVTGLTGMAFVFMTGASRSGSSASVMQQGAAREGLDLNGITVMYFRDQSASQGLGDIASGLSEGLISQLSQTSGLQITSRNAVSRYRDEPAPPDTVARRFRTTWVIEGDVDAAGANLNVGLRLWNGVNGQYDRRATVTAPRDSALALSARVSAAVAEFLTSIGSDLRMAEARGGTRSDAAWLLVRQADRARTDGENAQRAGRAEDAARAYVLADSLLGAAERADDAWAEPAVQRSLVAFRRARASRVPAQKIALYQEAMAHADRAIDRDPRSSVAYEYRGTARVYMYVEHLITDQKAAAAQYEKGIADLEQATTLDRKNASAWTLLSGAYAEKPDFSGAKLAAVAAYEADPFMLRAADILDRLYKSSYITETFNDADRYCGIGRARFPDDPRFVLCELWLNTVETMRPDPKPDAVWALVDSVQKLAPESRRERLRREGHIVAGIVLGRLKMADSAKRVLDAVMDTPREIDPVDELLYQNAYARLTLGDRKTAIQLLGKYLARNPEHREGWGKDSAWWWNSLKNDPEFQRLIATGR